MCVFVLLLLVDSDKVRKGFEYGSDTDRMRFGSGIRHVFDALDDCARPTIRRG